MHKRHVANTFVIKMPLKCCNFITTCRDGNFVLPLYSCVRSKCPGSSREQVQKQYRIILTIMKTSSLKHTHIRKVSILYSSLTSRTHYIVNILLDLDLISCLQCPKLFPISGISVFDLLPIDNSLQLEGYQQSLAGWQQKENSHLKFIMECYIFF